MSRPGAAPLAPPYSPLLPLPLPQAVASINQVGAQLSASQLQTHLAPLVLRLARNKDWFTPRVSASGLVALAYSECEDAPAVGAEL